MFDADSGEVLWTFTTPGPADAVALVGDTVYVGCRSGDLYALEAPGGPD